MTRNFNQQFKEQAIAHVLDHPQEPIKALAQSIIGGGLLHAG